MAPHVFTCGLPHGEQHALALVIARTILMRLPEVTEHDGAIHGRHDLGEMNLISGTCQHVATTHAAF